MKNIKVVIGANFGDEGKGLMTDYLSSTVEDGIVVRFNGGTQAGHTVKTPEGKRHVFGHIGSGSFTGLPTYLSSYFVVNPMTFFEEFNKLSNLIKIPTVYIDENCIVTTPYDMMINQIIEIVRGSSKHGSCGLGFNETIERSLQEDLLIKVKDLLDEPLLRGKLTRIRKEYTPKRLLDLGVNEVPEKYKSLLENDMIIESYVQDVKFLLNTAKITNISILNKYQSIVFEGSQGLLLDQSHEYFPYVTRSNTGMMNVRELVNQAGLSEENIEVVYVTRAYMTRHGVGPFLTELPEKPYLKIEDLTNVPNAYQDSLRFGLLDIDLLSKTIGHDLTYTEGLKCNVKLAISCVDQLEEDVDFVISSKKRKAPIEKFTKDVLNAVGVKEGYISHGKTRSTIKRIKL